MDKDVPPTHHRWKHIDAGQSYIPEETYAGRRDQGLQRGG